MRSIGSVLTLIILVAIFVGAGTYYMADQKMSQQKDELTKEIKDLQNKTSQIEQAANKVASDVESAKTAAQAVQTTAQDAAATVQAATTAPSTTAASVDTSKWKSYSSTKYSYSIKYPSDWEYKDATSGTAMNTIGFKPKTAKEYAFNVVVEKSSLDYSIGLAKKQMGADYTFQKAGTADINGKTFTTLSFTGKTSTSTKPVVYLIAKDDLVYHFTTDNNSDANINANIAEMVKSFVFVATETKTETKKP